MYCHVCGAKNNENAYNCYSCGNALNRQNASNYQSPQSYQDVPNYLVWSILATIFCCIPFGIVAIVYSAQVDTRLRLGDYAGALDASQKAKTFGWISFGIGLGAAVIYLLFMLLSF